MEKAKGIFSDNSSERIAAIKPHLEFIKEKILSLSVALKCLVQVQVPPEITVDKQVITHDENKNVVLGGIGGRSIPVTNFSSLSTFSVQEPPKNESNVKASIMAKAWVTIHKEVDALFFKLLSAASIKIPWYKGWFSLRVTRKLFDLGVRELSKRGIECSTIVLPVLFSSEVDKMISKFNEDFPKIRVISTPYYDSRVYFLPSAEKLGVIGIGQLCDAFSADQFLNGTPAYGFFFFSSLGMAINSGVVYSRKIK